MDLLSGFSIAIASSPPRAHFDAEETWCRSDQRQRFAHRLFEAIPLDSRQNGLVAGRTFGPFLKAFLIVFTANHAFPTCFRGRQR